MSEESYSEVTRRRFLAGAGAAAIVATPSATVAGPAQSTTAKWEPARHTQDDWLDRIPGKHRIVFDAIAGWISRATGSSTDEIYNEIAGNLVGNSHLAPAGIVAIGRAQERGYSFVLGV